jgi:hypothetical protein
MTKEQTKLIETAIDDAQRAIPDSDDRQLKATPSVDKAEDEDANTIWRYRPDGLTKHQLIAWALTEVATAIREHTEDLRRIEMFRIDSQRPLPPWPPRLWCPEGKSDEKRDREICFNRKGASQS